MKIVLLCWRDTNHPEGGGSERYLESVAQYLADQGHEVMFRTAMYPGAKRFEVVQKPGHAPVQFSRGGGNITVYPRAWLVLLAGRLGLNVGPLKRFGTPDVVVDTQNGVPFFGSLVSGVPTVVLTHHCHREQWNVAGPVLSRIGWLIESRISPWLHRRNRWVTVSQPSAEELEELGVDKKKVTIIRNGVDPVPHGLDRENVGKSKQTVRLVTLSRLVPHKQLEHALDAVAALHRTHPNVRLDIIGDGWWLEKLQEHAAELGVEPYVVFHGHVSEELKHRILQRADIHVMPSRKEGWGLAVVEAGQHAVPTVGYESSAGLRDSVIDGQTGLLAGSAGGFINAVEQLLDHPEWRRELGVNAQQRAREFSWDATGAAWAQLLEEVVGGVSEPPLP
ncbi:glycosyltransferase family 4 protein [Corynebacterium auriscanis]|uniref:glycosyltransferase family 4 protein n=1 Tax=Corynebacterium auriscanis TaxID=99807 RepID=UPI003CF49FBC